MTVKTPPLPELVEGNVRFDRLTVRLLGWLFLLLPTFALAALPMVSRVK